MYFGLECNISWNAVIKFNHNMSKYIADMINNNTKYFFI